MITRVTLSLDADDVALLDRFAKIQSLNRSEMVREILSQARPMMRQTVETLEAALRQRDQFLETIGKAEVEGLAGLQEEVERVQNSILGAMARLEGAAAVHESRDPRPSNHGGHTPTPPSRESTE